MKTLFITTALVFGLVILAWYFGPRLIKTVWLIMRVNPYEQTVPGAPNILVLGDSTGYGTGASASEHSIAGQIGRDFPAYSIENNSQNGRTIGELVPVTQELTGSYELILLQIGGNDILQKRDQSIVETELRTIIEALSQRTKQLVMISSGNVGGASAFKGAGAADYEARSRDFRAMFVRVASSTPLIYVDLFDEPANDPFIAAPDTYLAADGLHPSDAGYALWYQKLKPELQRALQK